MLGRATALTLCSVALAALVAAGAGAQPTSSALRVRITDRPSNPSDSPRATFEFSANEQASFTCSLDGARPVSCDSPKSYSELGNGLHAFIVRAQNRDRAGQTYTSQDAYRWTIDRSTRPPTPPPPPPPSPSHAPLLVGVVGHGSVTGPGISCPGDCSESVPLGTKSALAAAPAAGFGFRGWRGACTGGGACAPTVEGPVYVKAVFARSASATPGAADSDGDGVPRRKDVCLASDRRWQPKVDGCSWADLLQDPSPLLAELDEAIAGATALLRRHPQLSSTAPRFVQAFGLVEQGAARLARGDVCGGAALAKRGAQGLAGAAQKASAAIGRLQQAILNEAPAQGGDVGGKDFKWAALHYVAEQDLGAVTGGQSAERRFSAMCRALGQPQTLVATIAAIDDSSGLLELDDGVLVSFDTGAGSTPLQVGKLWQGARVRVVGRRLAGGPLVADAVVALDAPSIAKALAKPCVTLLIAPAQDFAKPSPILHDPRGYQGSTGDLWLEEGMRVAASPKCAAAKPATTYSLEIHATSSGSPTIPVAANLTPGQAPVPLSIPASAGGSLKTWTLTVTHRRQGFNCPPPGPTQAAMRVPAGAAKSYPCPIVVMGTTTYEVRIRPAASYAKAVYDRTVLDLESNGFAPAKVVALTAVHHTIVNPAFEADGYRIVGSQSAAFLDTIAKNQQFAVWPESWYGFPQAAPLASIGVDHYAGLEWPRVVGTRHGKPFRYRAALPAISTDLLPGCGDQSCLYRLPWQVDTIVETGQGNGPGAFSHNGAQQYAFDFSMPDKSTIYATRGGIVGDVVESNALNFNPCADNNGNDVAGDPEDQKADGPSNYVRVDHPDGTYSYYAHVDTNSVIPDMGDVVARGAPLAKVDNIGRSCGPHLHYQVAIDNTKTIYGQTTQVCFEAAGIFLPSFISPCYVPKTGDYLVSTNG
jgi:murein DD-endopeptidase MepM/ murein hydrolase activator NlpD